MPTSKNDFYTILLHLLYCFFLTRQSKKDSHHSSVLPLSISLFNFLQPRPNLQISLRRHLVELDHIASYIHSDTGDRALAERLMSHPVAHLDLCVRWIYPGFICGYITLGVVYQALGKLVHVIYGIMVYIEDEPGWVSERIIIVQPLCIAYVQTTLCPCTCPVCHAAFLLKHVLCVHMFAWDNTHNPIMTAHKNNIISFLQHFTNILSALCATRLHKF